MPTGGLELASNGGEADPFAESIHALREEARQLDPDSVSLFAVRANGAYPTWKEMQQRIEGSIGDQRESGNAALDKLEHPPINRGLPLMHMAAGLMSPTKTGAFGESLGYGMKGLTEGLETQQKHDLDFTGKAAALKYSLGKDNTAAVEGMYGLGMKSQQIETALAMMRSRLGNQTLTPAIKEWLAVNGFSPVDMQSGKIPKEKLAELQGFINLTRGTSQMKNAAAMLNPKDPGFANMVKLLADQKMVTKFLDVAEKRHPMTAYQGQDVSVRNSAVNQEFMNLLHQQSIGNSAGEPLPINGEAADLQRPAAAPSGSPALPTAQAAAPAAALPAAEPHPFDEYMAPISFQANRPGQIQSEQTEAAQKTSAAEGEKRASSYIEKEVMPGIKAADEMRTSAMIAKTLLDKDPKLTGAMKPFMANVGNVLETLGVAPKNVQQFTTDQKLFGSQTMLQVLAKQLDQKGVQTESDAKRIMQSGIDPANPPAANRFLVRYMEAAANRLQERAAFFDHWSKKNGGQMNGSVEAWSAYSKKNPMAAVHEGKVYFRDIELPK